MRFGLSIFATDTTMPPGDLGRLAEQRGFASLFLPEHTHIPVDHAPYPAGGELPERYKRSLDPFVALAAVAGATTTLRLGFGICLLVQRDPIITAKAVASLDWISGGRVDFGIGAGWNRPEIEHHGTPFDRRFKVMRERTEAMRALWTQQETSFDGEFVSFATSWSYPKPVQDPLPVYIGGNLDQSIERVLRYGDHYLPNRTKGLAERVEALRTRAEERGRPRPDVTYFGARTEAEEVEFLASAGVDQALFMLPTAPAGEVEEAADRAAELAAQFR